VEREGIEMFDSRCGSVSLKAIFLSYGQAVYLSWWPSSETKDMQTEERSVLEW